MERTITRSQLQQTRRFPEDLKYAIKVMLIIKAIEERYTIANGYDRNIVFSDDFLILQIRPLKTYICGCTEKRKSSRSRHVYYLDLPVRKQVAPAGV